MEEDDKGCPMIRLGVSGWVFLPVPAYPGCPGQKPLNGCVCVCMLFHNYTGTSRLIFSPIVCTLLLRYLYTVEKHDKTLTLQLTYWTREWLQWTASWWQVPFLLGQADERSPCTSACWFESMSRSVVAIRQSRSFWDFPPDSSHTTHTWLASSYICVWVPIYRPLASRKDVYSICTIVENLEQFSNWS